MKEHTTIAVVLDRSGSMSYVAGDTIGGFNEFLKGQQEAGDNADISLYQFDDKYDAVYEAVPIKEAPLLNRETYVPRGSTSLHDAVGRTISSLGIRLANLPENERPNKVMVIILTDGHENSSREYTHGQIKNLIETQQSVYSWEFVYIGATVDAITVGTGLGVKSGSSMQYGYGKERDTFKSINKSVLSYRGMTQEQASSLKEGKLSLIDDEDRKSVV